MGQCVGKESAIHIPHSNHNIQNNAYNHHHKLHINKQSKFDFGLGKYFNVLYELGEGGSGVTYLMQDINTEELVAVKLIKRPIPKVLHAMLMHEIQIQSELGEGHFNIVNARDVILTHSHLAFVLEYASGGTLTKYVSDRWDTVHERGGLFLTEDEALYFFKQFLSAVEYCHKHHVAHRDLKLDNTLLDSNDPPYIKICDFGFAKNFDKDSNMFTQIGTPVYMSPELISSKRGRMGYDGIKADIWASGVMLFVMLLGMFPYEHSEHPDPNTSAAQIEVWLQQIKSKWRENSRVKDAAKRLSPECQELLDHIFDLNERRRMSIEDIKGHPWFNRKLPEKFTKALEFLDDQNEKISQQIDMGNFKSRKRDEALKSLLSMAACVGQPTDEARHISMTKLQQSYSMLNLNAQMMGDLNEEKIESS